MGQRKDGLGRWELALPTSLQLFIEAEAKHHQLTPEQFTINAAFASAVLSRFQRRPELRSLRMMFESIAQHCPDSMTEFMTNECKPLNKKEGPPAADPL